MNARPLRSLLTAVVLSAVPLLSAAPAHAERNTLGPHFGINFDSDDPFLGIEGRFDLGTAGRSVIIQLNPSFSFYFVEDANLFDFSLNVPFEFQISDSVLRPMVAPGIAIRHWSNGGSDTDLKLNVLGGLVFVLAPVEPFVQLRIGIGDGSYVELMGGILFRL